MQTLSDLRYAHWAFLAFLLTGCSDAQWQTVEPSAGGFRAAFPAQHEETKQTVDSDIGPIDITFFMVEENSKAYVIAISDFPAQHIENNSPQRLLDGARDGAVANVRGKLLGEKKINISGNPGREIRIEIAGGVVIRARLYMVQRRLYQIQVVTGSNDVFSDDTEKFLNSFELI